MLGSVVPESRLESTEQGLVPTGSGWFVLNARDAPWWAREGRGVLCEFEGFGLENALDFEQLGVNLTLLQPGEPMSMYHWEADQEDFLVLSGEALLIVESQERPLRQWDLAHTPAGVPHTIVGAGSGPCVVLAIGARANQDGEGWGGYPLDETAARHNAAAEEETTQAAVAYARFPQRQPTEYGGWLD
jgi:uncharacterized cupin superfamily protein